MIASTWATGSGRRGAAACDSGTKAEVSAMAQTPIGMLTQKMARQPTVPARIPPRAGPSAMPTPNMPTQTLIARARAACPVKTPEMIDTATGLSIEPPAACSTRNTIRQPRLGAAEHSADPAMNTASPTRKTLRRPNRSAVAPPKIRRLASVIV